MRAEGFIDKWGHVIYWQIRAGGFIDKWGKGIYWQMRQGDLLTNEGRMIYWQMRQGDLLTNDGWRIYWQMKAGGFIDKWWQGGLLTNKGSRFYWQMRACDLLTNKGRGIYWEMRVGGLFAKEGCIYCSQQFMRKGYFFHWKIMANNIFYWSSLNMWSYTLHSTRYRGIGGTRGKGKVYFKSERVKQVKLYYDYCILYLTRWILF